MSNLRKTFRSAHIDLFKNTFHEIDSDNSGSLDVKEFERFLAEGRMNPQWASLLLFVYDNDGNGTIEKGEFDTFLNHLNGTNYDDPTPIYQEVFKRLDTNKDGILDLKELIHFCELLSYKVEASQFKFGQNHVNGLNFDEFKSWLNG